MSASFRALLLVGRNADRLAAVARHPQARGLDHRSRRRAPPIPLTTIFFRCGGRRSSARRGFSKRRSPPASTSIAKKPVAPTATEARARCCGRRKARGPQAWRGRGQASSTGLAENSPPSRAVASSAASFPSGSNSAGGCSTGSEQRCQRPSWNYPRRRRRQSFSICTRHWRYVIERLIGRIAGVASSAWTATPERVDERGQRYRVTVEDLRGDAGRGRRRHIRHYRELMATARRAPR